MRIATGQINRFVRPTDAYIESGGYIVSGSVPFWLRANQAGIVPLNGSTIMLRVGLYSDYRKRLEFDSLTKPKRFDWGYGLESISSANQYVQFIIPEAYIKSRWGPIELYVGRKRNIVGLIDTLLSSGSYAWSGNALPVPKIQIGTLGYVPLGFTKGFLSVNAIYNHGWFNNGLTIHSFLHQKAMYFRIGKRASLINITIGGNHEVQWGGYAPSLAGIPGLSDNQDGRFASDLAAYFRVITGSWGTGYIPPQGIISIDQGNRIGNSLGSLDGGIDIKIGTMKLFVYRQNFYETGALYYLTNITDGLNGIRLQRRQRNGFITIDHLLLEFFNSKSQGGPEFVINDPQKRGRNNYFNHSQYQDGWTYLGRTIGTPFITPQAEVNSELPTSQAIGNNRISLWHMGLSGRIAQHINWQSKLSYSQNFGTYDVPYPAGTDQFSAAVILNGLVRLPVIGSCQFISSLNLDRGKLLQNSFGCYLGLRKTIIDTQSQLVKKK